MWSRGRLCDTILVSKDLTALIGSGSLSLFWTLIPTGFPKCCEDGGRSLQAGTELDPAAVDNGWFHLGCCVHQCGHVLTFETMGFQRENKTFVEKNGFWGNL